MNDKSREIKKIPPLRGKYIVPPDESILQRSLFALAHSVGKSTVSPFFAYDSTVCTINCLKQLGVGIRTLKNSSGIEICGVGLSGFRAPTNVLNIGNSSIGLHLLLGSLATYPFQTIITGSQHSLSALKMRCVQHFADIGVQIEPSVLPIIMKGNHYCVPHEHVLKYSCSHTKSALLMAGLNIMGSTTIVEPFSGSRAHTENVLKHLGADIKITRSNDKTKTELHGLKDLLPHDLTIPGDPSVALFLVAAATLIPGSNIVIRDVCLNEKRLRTYKLLEKMGARFELKVCKTDLGEKIGEIHVRNTELTGITIGETDIPMENFRVLLFLLCTANGKSTIKNVEGLQVTKSHKFASFIEVMKELGARIEVEKNQIDIEGRKLKGGKSVNAFYDYYLTNLLILAGFITQEPLIISQYHPECFSFYDNLSSEERCHSQ